MFCLIILNMTSILIKVLKYRKPGFNDWLFDCLFLSFSRDQKLFDILLLLFFFGFKIQNWSWFTQFLIIRKTKLCFGSFLLNTVSFFFNFSIFSNPSDHDAYSLGFKAKPSSKWKNCRSTWQYTIRFFFKEVRIQLEWRIISKYRYFCFLSFCAH